MLSPVNVPFYIAAHSLALGVLCAWLRAMLVRTGQRPAHATVFSLTYVFCSFGAAKILFDLFKS